MRHTEHSSVGDHADNVPASAGSDGPHRRDWPSIIAENFAAADATELQLQIRYGPNHDPSAFTTDATSQGAAAGLWAPWAMALARLGYSTRRGRHTGVDLDRAARDYLLLTIPVWPRLPATMPRASEVTRVAGFPLQPPSHDQSAARPLQQATSERMKAGLHRFQPEAAD